MFRCAYRLEQVAEDVRTAAARTGGAFPGDWRGDAGIAYQQRLDTTADRVRRVSVAYDAAGAALVPYARALLEAQETAWRAESLFAQAAEAAQRSALAAKLGRLDGLAESGRAEALRAAACRLQAEAIEVERRAAAICAAALDDEASRAPATSGWRSVDRFVGDVARVGVDTVAGAASLIGSAWHALPGVGNGKSRHDARHELIEGARAAAAVWNIPIDIAHALQDDRSGLAVGAAAGAFGPGRLSKFRLRDPFLAHKEALREADRRALLSGRLARVRSIEALLRDGVDLANEELRGGHTLQKHVGASRAFLLARNRQGRSRAGTFRDIPTAERLINAVLREHQRVLPEVYALPDGERYPVTSTFTETTGRVTVKGSSRSIPAHAVTVVLMLIEGEPVVFTAYPEL
ncbi:MAG: hypothetical protein JJD92_00230 [Frankiaceae bacterium]|nr:hypothetical protein [Frankiaceae bacterium]